MPIRVVHVEGGTNSGSTRVVIDWVRYARTELITPTVCFFAVSEPSPIVMAELAELKVEARSVVKRSRYELAALPRLIAALRSLRPDAVILHGFGSYNYGAIAARAAGARAVVRVDHLPELHSPVHVVVSAVAGRMVDGGVAVSEHVADYLRERGTRIRRQRVIHNGIDLKRFTKVKRDPFSGTSPPTLLMVARLDRQKDHATLLAAFARLRARHPTVVLQLAGSGPLRSELEGLASELGISDAVEFLGHRTHVEHVLENADIVVFSTHYEGFGLAAAEALAAGRPLVATNVSSLPEIVTEGAGILVAPKDVGALEQAIESLLVDHERACEMGAEGRRRAIERFDLLRAVQSFEEHLLAVCEARGISARSDPWRASAADSSE